MITSKSKTARILVLDPSQAERRSLSLALKDGPFVMTETNTVESARQILTSEDIHLFLIHHTPDLPPAAELVGKIRRAAPAVEILLVMPGADPEQIAAVMNEGAFDCLSEVPPTATLMARARKAIEHRELRVSLSAAREHVAMNFSFDNLVGISKKMLDLRDTLARLAPTDIPVLITGPEGSGKTLCAHIIHHHSARRSGQFIIADCATPEPILMPELFGTEGSDRPGLLRQANGGTLLLKHVERMPAAVQARLAEFMKTFTLPGDSTKLSLRFVSTTCVDTDDLAAAAGIRRDLISRLNVIKVAVPSLCERAEDLEMLIDYSLRKIAVETGRTRLGIARPAVDQLLRWTWPGNVRELQNTLRRAAALTTADILQGESIIFVGQIAPESDSAPRRFSSKPANLRLADNQRELIEKALNENKWNYTQTAQELGIGRTTLWRKVKKYNLKPGSSIDQVVHHDG